LEAQQDVLEVLEGGEVRLPVDNYIVLAIANVCPLEACGLDDFGLKVFAVLGDDCVAGLEWSGGWVGACSRIFGFYGVLDLFV
jgi:hypothetical protein